MDEANEDEMKASLVELVSNENITDITMGKWGIKR
jgi:hypothetical protein